MSGCKLLVKFTGSEQKDNYIEYKIMVKEGANEIWQLQARYRRLRQIYKDLKDQFGKPNLPDFPPKKYINNKSPSFVAQRQKGLENFFNNVLKQFSLEELTSLKDFLYEGKKSNVRNSAPTQQTTSPKRQHGLNGAPDKKTIDKNKNKEIDKVIQQTKSLFFDLSDRYEPQDLAEMQRRKEMYKFKLNFEVPAEIYKLPKGTESNLIYVQDTSLVSQNPEVQTLGLSILDNIHSDLKNIKFSNIDEIIVNI